MELNKVKYRFFDFEVFSEWWCCSFYDYNDDQTAEEILSKENEIKTNTKVIKSSDFNAHKKLTSMFKQDEFVMIGHNIRSYDLVIANGIANEFGVKTVKALNDLIINPSLEFEGGMYAKLAPFAKKKIHCVYQDTYIDKTDTSLKQKESALGLEIDEGTVEFDKVDLTEKDIEEIIHYNKHDVWATLYYFVKVLKQFVDAKINIGQTFGRSAEEVFCNTNQGLICKVLEANRKHPELANDLRETITIPEKLAPYINKYVPIDLVKQLTTSKKSSTWNLFGNEFVFGNGGIHSVYDASRFAPTKSSLLYTMIDSDDKYVLADIDCSSFYPAILVYHDGLSRAVEQPEKFKAIYEERIALKAKKDKTPEDKQKMGAYKLILNGTYGASGCPWLNTFDPYRCSYVCRLGQLLAVALCGNAIARVPSLKIIQSNTDGIFVYYAREEQQQLDAVMAEFTEATDILLEILYKKQMIQKDVNNYLLVDDLDRESDIGSWWNIKTIHDGKFHLKPFNAFISNLAFREWYLRGKNIKHTISNCKDFSFFSVSCTKGSGFAYVKREFNDGRPCEYLGRQNRVYASTDKSLGMLYKGYKNDMFKGKSHSSNKMPDIPEHCGLCNKSLFDNNIPADLDLSWYALQTLKMIVEATFVRISPEGVRIEAREAF